MSLHFQPQLPPSSILILGAGTFGLSSAHALLLLPAFASTHITIVDAQLPASPKSDVQEEPSQLTLPASYDSSRLIRPDYASAPYARLVTRAQRHWRSNPIFSPFYHESGVVLAADEDLFSHALPSRSHASDASSPAMAEAADSANSSLTTGAEYVRSALENIQALHAANGSSEAATTGLPSIEVLPNPAAILAAMGHAKGCTGVNGYLNRRAGWADATGALASLQQRVKELGEVSGRVTWIRGTAERLIFEPIAASKSTSSHGSSPSTHRILGAHVRQSDPPRTEPLYADFTILALGAYTARLLPRTLGSQLAASAQTMAYVRLDKSEAEKLASMPVLLNLSSGFFIVPPASEGADHGTRSNVPTSTVLKAARHAHGWRHTEAVPDTEPPLLHHTAQPPIALSIPTISRHPHLPPPADAPLRAFLAATVPALAERPWSHERVCWYSETATGDFLVDVVPGYEGVLCSAGGSGHAFKFLPVLGGMVAALLARVLGLEANGGTETAAGEVDPRDGERDAVTARPTEMQEMAMLWRWRNVVGEAYGDASRGGEKGLRWNVEW